MKNLWDPGRHEALGDFDWDESVARSYIHQIVEDALAIYPAIGGWPLDPRDQEGDESITQATCIYLGAAGIIWALRKLEVALQLPMALQLKDLAYKCFKGAQTKPDANEPGYLISKGGPELLAYSFGFEEAAQALTQSIEACGSIDQPKELFWGPPASLLMAYLAYQIRNDSHWLDLLIKHGQRFFNQFGLVKQDVWQWPQLLYGHQRPCTVGAAHGFTGAMLPYALAYPVWPRHMQERMFDQLLLCIKDTAVETDTCANWPKEVLPGKCELLVQWCHGAPGIVSSLSYLPKPELASILPLLEKGGETIWLAGPLKKPAGLCHGTAGNAYAFLRLFAVSGDQKWLDRARRFAMHALVQSRAEHSRKGVWHYSLMTGDLGLAVLLADCIHASPGYYPALESFSFSK